MGGSARRLILALAAVLARGSAGCGDSRMDDAPLDATSDASSDRATIDGDGVAVIDGDGDHGPRDATIDDRWFESIDPAVSGLDQVRGEEGFADFHGRMAGGVCVLDVDRDGALDLVLPAPIVSRGLRLYRGDGALHFVERTRESGLAAIDAGGCLAFDLEGDGDGDLLTLGFGGARLFRNDGGSFVEVSERLPKVFDEASHYMGAVAFDADGDGMLDLAITDYGSYRAPPPGLDCVVTCAINNGLFAGGSTLLLLQRASGDFQDVSDRLGRVDEPGLVLLATDLDEDGLLDLFVGNDSPRANDRYFAGDGAGAFTDVAVKLGVAFNGRKNGVSSMSAFDADVDGDGHLDLLESSWEDDRDALFRCEGGACVDVAEDVELFRSPKNLRWGQALVDLDDDGVLELFEAAGHVYRDSDLLSPPDAGPPTFAPVSVPALLWHRAGEHAPFAIAEAKAGLSVVTAGRGVVTMDLDGDGALDAVVGTALGRPLLLRGVHGPRGHWLGVALAGKGKNSRGVGARVVVRAGAQTWTALVHAGLGYRSSIDAPLHFGLGDAPRVDSIEIAWPSGARSSLADGPGDRMVTIAEP